MDDGGIVPQAVRRKKKLAGKNPGRLACDPAAALRSSPRLRGVVLELMFWKSLHFKRGRFLSSTTLNG